MHPAIEEVLRYYEYEHLPEPGRSISARFHKLAHELAAEALDVPQKTVALNKLLEARDAAVRAALPRKTAADAAQEGWHNAMNDPRNPK